MLYIIPNFVAWWPPNFMFYFDFLWLADALCKKLEKWNHNINYTHTSLKYINLVLANVVQNQKLYLIICVCPLYNTARATLFGTIYQAIPLPVVPTIDTLLFGDQRLTITPNSSIISAVHNLFLTTKRLQ